MRTVNVVRWICFCALAAGGCAREHGTDAEPAPAPDGKAGTKAGDIAGNANRSADNADARVGARAVAVLEPTAGTDPDQMKRVVGTGTFSQTTTGVDLQFETTGCEYQAKYPAYIQAGSDCSDATLRGKHWDSPRGEGLPDLACNANHARAFYSRPKGDKKPWTIGSPSASNVIGHALVVYDPNTEEPLACGVISRAEDVAAPASDGKQSDFSDEEQGILAGGCLDRLIARDDDRDCPEASALVKCASTHCELDSCVAECSDYLACIQQSNTPRCDAAIACELSQECSSCQTQVTGCVWRFCVNELSCAPPTTAGGPCSQLEACCAMQGSWTDMCLDAVHLLAKVSGDASCFGFMRDFEANSHFPVPYKFE